MKGKSMTTMAIETVRIYLAALWIMLMLIYLLGDVLRLFSGDATVGYIDGQQATQWMWMLAALLMLIPILMIFVSLTMGLPLVRWVNIAAAVGLFLLNVTSIHTYPSAYDKFLLAVSLVFNAMTVWYAWHWA
jgi:Family of unknown function (DUF6326)